MEGFSEFVAEFGGWAEIGAGGLVGFIIFMILTGKLIPHSQVVRIEADREQWKNIAMKGMGVNEVQASTGEKLIELSETLEHFLDSLPNSADARGEIEAARPTEGEEPSV